MTVLTEGSVLGVLLAGRGGTRLVAAAGAGGGLSRLGSAMCSKRGLSCRLIRSNPGSGGKTASACSGPGSSSSSANETLRLSCNPLLCPIESRSVTSPGMPSAFHLARFVFSHRCSAPLRSQSASQPSSPRCASSPPQQLARAVTNRWPGSSPSRTASALSPGESARSCAALRSSCRARRDRSASICGFTRGCLEAGGSFLLPVLDPGARRGVFSWASFAVAGRYILC